MKQTRTLLCLAAVAVLVLAACGRPASPVALTVPASTMTPLATDIPIPTVTPTPGAGALVGSYSLAENDQKLLFLLPDGTAYWWDDYGTYTVSGDQITFVDVWDCTEPGVYRWSLDGTKLRLRAIGQDPCVQRHANTLTWFVKQPDLPFVGMQRLTDGRELTSLALDRQGYLYAVDQSSLTILKFGPDGSQLATFGGSGTGDGQFLSVGALVVDSQGHLYAADTEGKRVVRFDAAGEYLGALELASLARPGPLGLAVDGEDNVYIGLLGIQDHYVEKWSADGRRLATWGSRGTGDGQFGATGPNGGPRGIAVDGQGTVYVADLENHRVQAFDAGGKLLRSLTGCGAGEFEWPFSLAVDARANLYVLDGMGHLFKCGADGQSLGEWLAPWGYALRIDAAGSLFLLIVGDIARIELPRP